MDLGEAAKEYAEAVHAEQWARKRKASAAEELDMIQAELRDARRRLNIARDALVACALAETKPGAA